MQKRPEKIIVGAAFALLSSFCLAIMGVLVKAASSYTTSSVLVFFQNLISFIFILPMAFMSPTFTLRTNRIGMHFFRAATGTGAWYGLFLAITRIPLSTAVLLTYSAPIWLALFSWLFFKEKVTWYVWFGIALGFIGIILVLNPGGNFNIGMLFAVGSAILLAFALYAIRWLGTTESLISILFYYFLISSILIAPLAILNWQTPETIGWIYILGIGLCLIASQVFVVIAYQFASPVRLGPYIYSVIVFSAILDRIIWGQTFSRLELGGIFLVIIGGVLAAIPDSTKRLL